MWCNSYLYSKGFVILILQKRWQKKTVFNHIVQFTQLKPLSLNLKHTNTQQMVENSIKIIQCLTFLSDITFLLLSCN